MAVLFDIPVPVLAGSKTLDDYLGDCAAGVHQAIGRARVYVDPHDLPLELRTSSGISPLAFLVDALNRLGSQATPVTGTEADRGQEYLDAVRTIVSRDRRGVCIRLAEEDIDEPDLLHDMLIELLGRLALDPSQADPCSELSATQFG